MRTLTLAPSILPLLEAPAEGFFWNLPEFGRRIRFDVLHGWETRPLVAHFQSRQEPKVTPSEIRRLRWLGDDRNAFLVEEMLYNKRCVARCVIVVQKPLSLPHVAPFPPELHRASIAVITQPPYSPDLVPSHFWLFPTLKMGHKGTRFATMEDIKSNTTAELRKIPKEAFRRCFQQWQDRWGKCVCVRARVLL